MSRAGSEPGIVALVWQSLRRPMGVEYRAWRSFGWVLLLLLLIEVVTGGLLAIYYEPVSEHAPHSIRMIQRDVRWGWLVRGLHHWTSQALFLCALALGVREVLTGGYRGRRAALWIVGLLLSLLILAELFTGEILRWDRGAHNLLQAFLGALQSLPGIGPTLVYFLAGGDEIGPQTLERLHAIHAYLLPWAIALALVSGLWILLRLGAREREESAARKQLEKGTRAG